MQAHIDLIAINSLNSTTYVPFSTKLKMLFNLKIVESELTHPNGGLGAEIGNVFFDYIILEVQCEMKTTANFTLILAKRPRRNIIPDAQWRIYINTCNMVLTDIVNYFQNTH